MIDARRVTKSIQNMVSNGLITQEQADEIWAHAGEEGRKAYHEAKREQHLEAQRRASVKCCDNCRWFSFFAGGISNPYVCLKHSIDFTYDDINNDRHRKSICDDFSPTKR